ncbi:hypothetical protein D3C77_641850 [compost metagenome]
MGLKSVETETVQPNDVSFEASKPTLVKGNPDTCRKRKHRGKQRVSNRQYDFWTGFRGSFAEEGKGEEDIDDNEQECNQAKAVGDEMVKEGTSIDKTRIDATKILDGLSSIRI